MKKLYVLTAFVMLAMAGISVAGELRQTPHGDHPQALATADYGGVYYSTALFGPLSGTGISVTTVCAPCTGVFYGFMFSSGAAGALDFVDVFDATSTVNTKQAGSIISRIYNQNGSTSTAAGSTQGFTGPPKPIRFNKGLMYKPSVGTYNVITGLFYSGP